MPWHACSRCFFGKKRGFREWEGPTKDLVVRDIKVKGQEVHKLLKARDVRKAPGPGGISNWVCKESREQLTDKNHSLTVCSLTKGKVPQNWKKVDVAPIYKGGNKEEPLNYNPVSLASFVTKLCGRILKDRWIRYLEGMVLCQTANLDSGKRLFVTNLLSFYSRVTDGVQEKDRWMDCVYLDLEKASDKVSYNQLLRKVEHLGGLKRSLLEWTTRFPVWPTDKDKISGWREATSGVPQG